MKRTRPLFLFLLFLLVPITRPANAQSDIDGAEVISFLRPKIHQVLRVLEQTDLTDPQKKQKIETVIDPVFDYRLMAKLAMGRTHWTKMSDAQKERYVDLFTRVLKMSYFEKMSEVSGVNVAYGKPSQQGKRKVYLPTTVQFRDKEIEVEYRLYRPGEQGDWKLFDVVIKGVSIVKSHHSQYRDFLSGHSYDELFDKMSSRIDSLTRKMSESGE